MNDGFNPVENVYTVRNDFYGRYEPLYLCPADSLMVYRVIPLLQQQFGPQALQHCVCYKVGTFNPLTAEIQSCPPVVVPWTVGSPEVAAQPVKPDSAPAAREAQFRRDTQDLSR